MAARVPKHEHVLRIISHYDDFSRVLVMCKNCPHTETLGPGRVKYAEGTAGRIRGRYRAETTGEFQSRIQKLDHICCD